MDISDYVSDEEMMVNIAKKLGFQNGQDIPIGDYKLRNIIKNITQFIDSNSLS